MLASGALPVTSPVRGTHIAVAGKSCRWRGEMIEDWRHARKSNLSLEWNNAHSMDNYLLNNSELTFGPVAAPRFAMLSTVQVSPMIWSLVGRTNGSQELQCIELCKSPFKIGRRPGLDLTLSPATISSLHAELFCGSCPFCETRAA